MNKVKYTIKDYKDYDSGIYKDFVYFAKDKKKVIVNGVEYGLDVLSDDISILESIEFKDNKLKLKYTNGKEDEIELYDPNKYWDELIVVDEEFNKGGCIIKTHPIKEFSFKGEGSGNWYSSDGQEGLYTASDKTIIFEEEGEYTLKFVNNYTDGGYNGLINVTDNSVKSVLMIGGSKGITRGVKPVNKNENAKLIFYNNITNIDNLAFSGCSGFTGELKLPETLTSIGSMAFYNCSGFTGELKLPETLTSIETYAFSGCSGFTGDLFIPRSVQQIGRDTFSGCKGFTGELKLPLSITSIGEYAFNGCTGFSKIYVCEDTELGNNWNTNTTAEVIKYKKGETPWLD